MQLEEIKTKERNIGQLRKDLLALQSPKKQQQNHKQNEAKVPATTKPKTNTNETSQKPKKKPTTNPAKPTGETKAENEPDTDDIKDIQNPIRQAQVTPEVSRCLFVLYFLWFIAFSEWGQALELVLSGGLG